MITYNKCSSILKKYDKNISYGLYIDFQPEFLLNEDKKMISASIIKLYILYYIIKTNLKIDNINSSEIIKTEDSLLNFMDSDINMDFLISMMIDESDNAVSNFFIDKIGMDNLNLFIKNNGFNNTLFERKFLDYNAIKNGKNNYSSVNDIKKLFYRVLTSNIKNDFMKFLYMQKDKSKSAFYLNDLKIAGKTGELYNALNDVIFYEKNNKKILNIVFINNVPEITSKDFITSMPYHLYNKL